MELQYLTLENNQIVTKKLIIRQLSSGFIINDSEPLSALQAIDKIKELVNSKYESDTLTKLFKDMTTAERRTKYEVIRYADYFEIEMYNTSELSNLYNKRFRIKPSKTILDKFSKHKKFDTYLVNPSFEVILKRRSLDYTLLTLQKYSNFKFSLEDFKFINTSI